MPSRTRRKYRGGDNLSNCEKWVKANNLDDEKEKCKQMETKITFPTPGFFSSGPPPVTPMEVGVYGKGTKLNFGNWDGIYDGLFNPSAAQAPVVSKPYVGPQGRQLPKCAAYNKESGKNVYLANKEENRYSELCDSAQLPLCTQWKKRGDTWATTGPNGEFCNVAALPMGNTFSKLNTQSEANVNMDRVTYPLQRHPSGIIYASGNYDQYRGGKRSRRKSRKSRR
jgi:hypothetical protein